MRYVRPRPSWIIVLSYFVGGAMIGGTLLMLKSYASGAFGRAGLAVAFVVNIGMPLLVVALAAAYPRLLVALVGTATATFAFLIIGGGGPLNPLQWPAATVSALAGSPILTVACVMYHILALIAVIAVSSFRRVGIPPDPLRCPGCGYSLVGLIEPRCPECFRAVDLSRKAPG